MHARRRWKSALQGRSSAGSKSILSLCHLLFHLTKSFFKYVLTFAMYHSHRFPLHVRIGSHGNALAHKRTNIIDDHFKIYRITICDVCQPFATYCERLMRCNAIINTGSGGNSHSRRREPLRSVLKLETEGIIRR